ncbi:hypothetical protein GCM10010349_77470 [Streptomyces flavofungini]|uniref:WHG domain-containing protein n=1 Tax=Streptomyces flavofungini TaxID=68200 RepID=A0ABS0XIU3_9ACTN|nr:WHG domain-containing protein [Streptomyces flavofungini]GHC89547.1 hypothetical protein GCM10010349_77470 [Streptomyces flavofungini]
MGDRACRALEVQGAAGELRAGPGRPVRYVRFGVEHPAHFQVMFDPDLLRGDDSALLAARARAGAELRAGVAGVPASGRGEDARLAGIAAWSLAHGFATLLLSENLRDPVGERDPEDVFRALAELLFNGDQ